MLLTNKTLDMSLTWNKNIIKIILLRLFQPMDVKSLVIIVMTMVIRAMHVQLKKKYLS